MNSLEIFARAIEAGDVAKVTLLLLDATVDANAYLPGDGRLPALVHATLCNQKEIVELLLRWGAYVDSTNKYGSSCLELAILNRYEECALLLINAGANLCETRLCETATLGIRVLRALINQGVVVSNLRVPDHTRSLYDSEFAYECTPLHIVAKRKHRPALLSMLVHDCGVDMDARDSEGNTPCHYAVIIGENVDNLRWLIDAGAEFDTPNCLGETPLHLASVRRNVEYIVLLIAAGSNVNARTKHGNSPCQCCLLYIDSWLCSMLSSVNAFIAAGADLDTLDNSGTTVRQRLAGIAFGNPTDVDAMRRRIEKTRIDMVRNRAVQVCIGLQSLNLDALQMCEILQQACLGGRFAKSIPFHIWWKFATTVKHFCRNTLSY